MSNYFKLKHQEGDIHFEIQEIEFIEKNIENVWLGNQKKKLGIYLDKAIDINFIRRNPHPLKNKAVELKNKYNEYLNYSLADFIKYLKSENNLDFKYFLNKYGDNKFCNYRVNEYLNDKGLYCYILDNEILYLGRSLKTFKERLNIDYGRITPYNCLIDGQATDCHINSLVNEFSVNGNLKIGIYVMTNKTNEEIKCLEKQILSQFDFKWNIQKS